MKRKDTCDTEEEILGTEPCRTPRADIIPPSKERIDYRYEHSSMIGAQSACGMKKSEKDDALTKDKWDNLDEVIDKGVLTLAAKGQAQESARAEQHKSKDVLGKPTYSLLFTEFMDEMVKVRMLGKKKYLSHESWRDVDPMDWLEAIERHVRKLMDERQRKNGHTLLDSVDGVYHTACIAVSAMYYHAATVGESMPKSNPFEWFSACQSIKKGVELEREEKGSPQ